MPVEIVSIARRGNSRNGPFSAVQWKLDRFVYDGVAQFIKLTNGDGGTGKDISDVPHSGTEYGHRKNAILPHCELGRHTLSATLTLTLLDSPQGVEIPADFDLGQVDFTVVPPAESRVRLIDEPGLAKQISRRITIDTPIHWPDGQVTTFIETHRPPVDVAFDVFLDVGGREWNLGQISAPRCGDSDVAHSSFSVQDGKHVPACGLVFRFRSNPEVARQSVARRECWSGEVTAEPRSNGGR